MQGWSRGIYNIQMWLGQFCCEPQPTHIYGSLPTLSSNFNLIQWHYIFAEHFSLHQPITHKMWVVHGKKYVPSWKCENKTPAKKVIKEQECSSLMKRHKQHNLKNSWYHALEVRLARSSRHKVCEIQADLPYRDPRFEAYYKSLDRSPACPTSLALSRAFSARQGVFEPESCLQVEHIYITTRKHQAQ